MIKNFTKLYNSERKLRFLNEEYPNDTTRKTYGSLLQRFAQFEEYYKKDLCDFSLTEAIDSLIGLRKKTFNSLNVAHTIVMKYVQWCLEQGYSKTGINAFRLIDSSELPKYLHQIAQKESYFSRERIFEIISDIFNPIDKAMIILLFEGAKGYTEFEELRNLKKTDIFPTQNTLILTRDNGQQRVIQVEDRTMDILVDAIHQEEYYKDNGEAKGIFAVIPLRDTPYLFRAVDNGNISEERIAVSSINTRFRAFRRFTGLNYLNPTLIFQSGLLERCQKIEEGQGSELTSDDYKQIYRDLNLDTKNWYNLKVMYQNYKKNITQS